MYVVRRCLGLSLVGLLAAGTLNGRGQAPSPPVDVKAVKYDGLTAEVLKHKGKVVVVDCWGIT